MNRTYNSNPTEAMKSILEKEVNLDQAEMAPFLEEDMICLYSGHHLEFLENKAQKEINPKKKPVKMP